MNGAYETRMRDGLLNAWAILKHQTKSNILGLVVAFASLCVAIYSCHNSNVSLDIAQRGDAPNIQIMGGRVEATPDPDKYDLSFYFENYGRRDASGIIKVGSINSTTKEVSLLGFPVRFTRLSSAKSESTPATFTVPKSDLHNFLMFCISYSDEHTDSPPPDFYSVPDRPASVATFSLANAGERETLLSGFSCVKLAK
jgi:hypothetical protein